MDIESAAEVQCARCSTNVALEKNQERGLVRCAQSSAEGTIEKPRALVPHAPHLVLLEIDAGPLCPPGSLDVNSFLRNPRSLCVPLGQ